MANEHPFQHLFEILGRTPHVHAEPVNRKAYEMLSDILTVPLEKTGRCILLRAPRAGHGKTHLLSRIQHQMGGTHEFIPLHASFGCRIDAASVIDDTLRCLVKQLPASGGLCVLDLLTRRLFASALQPLVGSGEVPCQDREGALAALRLRPIETFDFHHPNAVTAHWARENFEVLGQRLSLELAQRAGLPVREVAFWVETLFHFAASPLENSNRVRVLADAVHAGTGGEMERLEALLGLVTQLMRVVLVADDLEGFSSDETAALRFGAFLGGLRQTVDRLDVILSLNLDIWESAFVPRLSGGLADRLSEVVVELEPLKESEMAALLDSRVPGLGGKVLERIDLGNSGTHARGLIRAAGMAWLKATAMDAPPAVEPAPVVQPAPVVAVVPVLTPMEPVASVEVPSPAPPEAVPAPVFETQPIVEKSPPAAEAAAFTFSPEVAVATEAEPVWPAPEFSPPAAVELEPPAPPISTPEPAVQMGVFHQPEAQTPWNPPVAVTEPVAFQPPVESPFQVPSAEPIVPEAAGFEPAAPSPFQPAEPYVFNPPPSQPEIQPQSASPFEAAPPAFEAAPSPFEAPEPEPQPPAFNPPPSQPEIQPQFASPFEAAPSPFVASEPAPQPPAFSQGTFQPVSEPSFQPAAHEPYTFNPPPTQPVDPSASDFPFQASPSPFLAAEPAPQEPVYPQGNFQPAVESPFQAAPQVFTPAEPAPPVFQPAPVQPAAAAEVTPPASAADTDRVDDLLRQFRERYGRGSL